MELIRVAPELLVPGYLELIRVVAELLLPGYN
jgi:hypothetical protein